jgi:tetratricopeptide (TPR) repeat protein/SAM-dependent methyltransferase
MDYSKLKPGDNNYRAYVGPPTQYDFMGATQFRLLCTLGLRADHKVLDLGCGSLRAGRFLISYLERGNYHGIEPNKWLIDEAIKEQLGSSVLKIKEPNFDYNAEFNTHVFNTQFDFIIAQSIFSHTGFDLLEIALNNIKSSLTTNGCALVTFIKGDTDFEGKGWVYPECVEFTRSTILSIADKLELKIKELPWFHPRQTWFFLTNNVDNLPLNSDLPFLSGAVLRSPDFINSKSPLCNQLELPKEAQTDGLIISGFHRSGTSAIANYIEDAGLNLGADLMAGGISNAKGHFEDWPAVKLHNTQLINNYTSWQFHDECELSAEPDFLRDYIAQRSENIAYWGVKDPRACLFLNEWEQSLGDKGVFVFVVRHWSSCVESLLHRHSRELAYDLTDVTSKSVDVSFWAQPTLAAKMWLSYTKRLVSFVKKHPQKTLMITQRALFEGAPVLQAINSKFGFQLDENTTPPFDVSLFRDKASQRIFSELSTALQVQLNSVWEELLALATFKAVNELPVIVEEAVDEQAVENIYTQIRKLPRDSFSGDALSNALHSALDNNVLKQRTNKSTWYEQLLTILEPAVMIKYLDGTTAEQIQNIGTTKWLTFIDDKFATQGDVFLSVAKLFMKISEQKLAIRYFQKAVTLGVYFPFVDAMLGQCYQGLNAYSESEFHFKKAIQKNPNQAMFYIHYAKLLTFLKQDQKAKVQYKLGYDKGCMQPAVVMAYCNFLVDNNELSKGIDIAEAFMLENQHPALVNLLTRMKLKQNVVIGQDYYIDMIAEKIKGKNLHAWLAKTCLLIDSATAEKDFITRCLGHWNKVL